MEIDNYYSLEGIDGIIRIEFQLELSVTLLFLFLVLERDFGNTR